MLKCDIAGCKESISEILSSRKQLARWIVLKQEEWPSLDWHAYGGVDKITLCPQHRFDVMRQIIEDKKREIN